VLRDLFMATSFKLPPQLKSRVERAAKAAGKSPHAFMVEAIEQRVGQAERRQRLIAEALTAQKEALAKGQSFDADEVHAAMEARARGGKARHLKGRPWRKSSPPRMR
jgi:predicted transcriptional regulator